jgi:hypothetical protein
LILNGEVGRHLIGVIHDGTNKAKEHEEQDDEESEHG